MNRRDFLAAISAAYGVTVLPPLRRPPTGDVDFVAQAEARAEAARPVETINVPVAFLDASGHEHLRKDVAFSVERAVDLYGQEVIVFKAVENPTWESVPPPLVIDKIAALIPFGATTHRVHFPISGPIYANGGNITVADLKATLL